MSESPDEQARRRLRETGHLSPPRREQRDHMLAVYLVLGTLVVAAAVAAVLWVKFGW